MGTYFSRFLSWGACVVEFCLCEYERCDEYMAGTYLIGPFVSGLPSWETSLVGTYLCMLQGWGGSLLATYTRKKARVAKLKICRDSACSFPTKPHLVVDLINVPLHRNNATAISYAWGEFDRQKRPVGHTFQTAEPVQLELGTEWVVSDVVDRLAELAADKPVWMDQLCIRQEEDEVLKTLADMPSIFSKLDVVALLPGSLCGCITKLVGEINRLSRHDHGRKDGKHILKRLQQEGKCLSSGAFSWNRRMWTYHELMHSQRVRCVWASKIENPCVRLHDPDINWENLPPFQRRMFEMLTTRGVSQANALANVRRYLETTHQSMTVDLFLYGRITRKPYHGEIQEQFYQFLLGKQMFKRRPSGLATYHIEPITHFVFRLSGRVDAMNRNSRVRREATKPRDYIVSVWTSCPDYVVPDEYKSMSIAGLMQDAVNQFQCNHEMTLAVTAPQGLFDAESQGSALWKPLEYLSAVEPSCDMDLYKTLADEGMAVQIFPQLGDSVPILLHDTAQPSLSTSAIGYHVLVAHLHVESSYMNEEEPFSNLNNGSVARIVIQLLHWIMSYWTNKRAEAVRYAIERVMDECLMGPVDMQNLQSNSAIALWCRRIGPIQHHMRFLYDHRKTKDFDERYDQELNSLFDSPKPEQIHDIVYNVVAAALELDLEYCEKKNVQLIFSSVDNDEGRPPRVGFCRGDVDIEEMASGEKKTITVSVGGFEGRPSTLLYEAVHVDSENENLGRPAYQVFAVWVPTESIADDEFGASARWIDFDLAQTNFGVLV